MQGRTYILPMVRDRVAYILVVTLQFVTFVSIVDVRRTAGNRYAILIVLWCGISISDGKFPFNNGADIDMEMMSQKCSQVNGVQLTSLVPSPCGLELG